MKTVDLDAVIAYRIGDKTYAPQEVEIICDPDRQPMTALSDAESDRRLLAWMRRNPAEFERQVRRINRIYGDRH